MECRVALRTSVRFGPFLLDPTQGLARGERKIHVTPKSLALLGALVERAGEIVLKEELFLRVWPSSVVTDAALSSCILELRHALGDNARRPRYIETIHRRGFRFLAICADERRAAIHREAAPSIRAAELIDRDAERASLRAIMNRVREGTRQVAFVTGATGVGATALVETCLAEAAHDSPWLICKVACAEAHGELDAYGPVVTALWQLRRMIPGGSAILRKSAPSWLGEFPAGEGTEDRVRLRQRTAGATSSRLRNELNGTLEAFAARQPLALFFDDLQWCDSATVEWLDQLVRANAPGSILVIATLSGDPSESPPRQILNLRGLAGCTFIELAPIPGPVAAFRREIVRRLATLTDRQRRVLEAASVAGSRFTNAEVAAGNEMAPAETERLLAGCRASGAIIPGPVTTWPDGTTTTTDTFAHDGYRRALYDALEPARRDGLHRRIGRRLAAGNGRDATEIAAVLAAHFERGGENAQAVEHLHEAGVIARRRCTHETALSCFRRALALSQDLPSAEERYAWEAQLRIAIGRELLVTEGLRSEEAEDCYARAYELQRRVSLRPRLGGILWGLWVYFLNRGPLDVTQQIADDLLDVATQANDPALALEAHHAQWCTALMRGDLDAVLTHVSLGMAVCGSKTDGALAMTSGCTLHDVHLDNHHAAICAGFIGAWADMLQGGHEVAGRALDAAVTHARDVGHPFTLAVALVLSAAVLAAGGDAVHCAKRAAEGRGIADEHGFAAVAAWASIYEGWALVRLGCADEGLPLIDRGLAFGKQIGISLFRPFQLALAADAHLRCGRLDIAESCVKEGFDVAERYGDGLAIAELDRMQGRLVQKLARRPSERSEVQPAPSRVH